MGREGIVRRLGRELPLYKFEFPPYTTHTHIYLDIQEVSTKITTQGDSVIALRARLALFLTPPHRL